MEGLLEKEKNWMWQLQPYQPDLNRLLEQLSRNKDRKEDKTFVKYFSIFPITEFL